MITIRPPDETEYEAIRRMVRAARLDPTTRLHFEHALVAEVDGQVVGVGQIKHLKAAKNWGRCLCCPNTGVRGSPRS